MRLRAEIEGSSGLVFFYEICVKRVYDLFPRPADQAARILFDVGANCGFLALSRCLQNSVLEAYCFEPHPKTFEILRANIELNQLTKRIFPVSTAVGATTGTCRLNIGEDSSMGVVATSTYGGDANATSIEVPLTSLDDFCCAHNIWPDVVKIDVEGFEAEVLSGARKCLKRAKRVLLEYHNDTLKRQCQDLLNQAGYRVQVMNQLIFADAEA
jgi:FkbM family methyltransferase